MLQTYWALSAGPSALKGRGEKITYAHTTYCCSDWIIKQFTIDYICWISNQGHIFFIFLFKIYFYVCSAPNPVTLNTTAFA